jgi:hypothetical protein
MDAILALIFLFMRVSFWMANALSSFQAEGLVNRPVAAVEVKIKAKGIQFLRRLC